MSEVRNRKLPEVSAPRILEDMTKLRSQALGCFIEAYTEADMESYLNDTELNGLSDNTLKVLKRILAEVVDETTFCKLEFEFTKEDEKKMLKFYKIENGIKTIEDDKTRKLRILYQGASNEFLRWKIAELRTKVILIKVLGYDDSIIYEMIRRNILRAIAKRFIDSPISVPIPLISLLNEEDRAEILKFCKQTIRYMGQETILPNNSNTGNNLVKSIQESISPIDIGMISRTKIEGIIQLSSLYTVKHQRTIREAEMIGDQKKLNLERVIELLKLLKNYPDPGVLTDILICAPS